MLAIVRTAAEATSAAAAGADAVALVIGSNLADVARSATALGPSLGVPLGLVVPLGSTVTADDLVRVREATGAADIRLALDQAETLRELAQKGVCVHGLVTVAAMADAATVRRAADLGARGIMVESGSEEGRLVDGVPPDRLVRFAADCRGARLALCLAGQLEGPDIPRLLAFGPDELGFDLAIRKDGDPSGSIAAEAIEALRALMTGDEPRRARPAQELAPDRIFVRDLTLSMSIGAYARERNAPQRIRLSVEAEVRRRSQRVADLRDVVSYDLITDAVTRLAAAHIDLVETFAEAIADAVLRHPRVDRVTVTVEKLDVVAGSVGCQIVRAWEEGPAGVAPTAAL